MPQEEGAAPDRGDQDLMTVVSTASC